MSERRQWDENRSPQWKYLFQKESANRRRTRKDLDKEIRDNIKEEEEKYNEMTKFGETAPKKKRTVRRGKRKVSKGELQKKLQKEILLRKSTL